MFPNNAEIENTIIAGNFDNSPAKNDLKPDVSGDLSLTQQGDDALIAAVDLVLEQSHVKLVG